MKPIGFSEFAEFAELGQLGFTRFYSANSEKPIGTELTELGELGTERCLWVSVKYWKEVIARWEKAWSASQPEKQTN